MLIHNICKLSPVVLAQRLEHPDGHLPSPSEAKNLDD